MDGCSKIHPSDYRTLASVCVCVCGINLCMLMCEMNCAWRVNTPFHNLCGLNQHAQCRFLGTLLYTNCSHVNKSIYFTAFNAFHSQLHRSPGVKLSIYRVRTLLMVVNHNCCQIAPQAIGEQVIQRLSAVIWQFISDPNTPSTSAGRLGMLWSQLRLPLQCQKLPVWISAPFVRISPNFTPSPCSYTIYREH